MVLPSVASNRNYLVNAPSGTRPERLLISSVTVWRRILITVPCIVAVVMWLAALAVTVTAFPRIQRGGALLILNVMAFFFIVYLVILLAEVYLFAVWVEGPVLIVRHFSGEKRWNLPSAVVTVRTSPWTTALK